MVTAIRNSLVLTLAVMLTAVAFYLATIHRGYQHALLPIALGAVCTLLACLPPLYAQRLLSNGAAQQLAVVAWRFGIILPALAIATKLPSEQRNYFLISMLACYFVALPLESWLLIRDLKR